MKIRHSLWSMRGSDRKNTKYPSLALVLLAAIKILREAFRDIFKVHKDKRDFTSEKEPKM